jgi:hypothetical protein
LLTVNVGNRAWADGGGAGGVRLRQVGRASKATSAQAVSKSTRGRFDMPLP